MLRMSSQQYALLQQLPGEFDIEFARKLKQTTLGSFKVRGYVKKQGSKFRVTATGVAAGHSFGTDNVFRKIASDRISVHFREVLEVRKRTA